MLLFIGTDKGVVIYESTGETWREAHRTLEAHEVTSLTASKGVILAGTRHGVYRSEDICQTWTESSSGLDMLYVRWLATHPEKGELVFAGTEPAGIYRSLDGGGTWKGNPGVERLRDHYHWSLPYSPAAGCVRGFAFHGERVYAAAEVGGVLRSDDMGSNWTLVNGDSSGTSRRINADVHSLNTHPSSPELAYGPTGGGFYRSWDGGASWENHYQCYCRAVWADPKNPDHMILGPAESVDRGGRIEQSLDGGVTWKGANIGLSTPWSRYMVERFYQIENQLAAVLSNGEIIISRLEALEWQPMPNALGRARAIAWMKGYERK